MNMNIIDMIQSVFMPPWDVSRGIGGDLISFNPPQTEQAPSGDGGIPVKYAHWWSPPNKMSANGSRSATTQLTNLYCVNAQQISS